MPEAVYDTLVDVDGWNGLGAVVGRRVLGATRGAPDGSRWRAQDAQRRLLDGSRPHLHSYNVLSPPPALSDYQATVVIEPRPEGCVIVWSPSFTCLVPGLGRPLQAAIRWHVARLAAGLSNAAES
ncbi:SRPBCC family protein [Mycobacterium bourgelatii]|nr:SRPBCC family protein [Mycobacterium bourgelatii]